LWLPAALQCQPGIAADVKIVTVATNANGLLFNDMFGAGTLSEGGKVTVEVFLAMSTNTMMSRSGCQPEKLDLPVGNISSWKMLGRVSHVTEVQNSAWYYPRPELR